MMDHSLIRVGTVYLPVADPSDSAGWYADKLGGTVNYLDDDKAILDLANQSFFLVRAAAKETANFRDFKGALRFSLTFEVDGETELTALRERLLAHGVTVGEIEDRGHAGRNFVFSDPDGNLFDVWSVLAKN